MTTATSGPVSPLPLRVVALVASAGGLAVLTTILAVLPADFPASLLVVQHIAPDRPSSLAYILRQQTALSVTEARGFEMLEAGHVYIAPPDHHMVVNADLTLSLSDAAKVHNSRPAGNVLFASVAANIGRNAIGIVLTGFDGDGAEGLRAIKSRGCVTMAQDAASSREFSMPQAAIATGAVDFVLSAEQIPLKLMALMGK
jgi:two-component system chemotaxis response regulator CheB